MPRGFAITADNFTKLLLQKLRATPAPGQRYSTTGVTPRPVGVAHSQEMTGKAQGESLYPCSVGAAQDLARDGASTASTWGPLPSPGSKPSSNTQQNASFCCWPTLMGISLGAAGTALTAWAASAAEPELGRTSMTKGTDVPPAHGTPRSSPAGVCSLPLPPAGPQNGSSPPHSA